jgi:DNA-directed RNA polymerase
MDVEKLTIQFHEASVHAVFKPLIDQIRVGIKIDNKNGSKDDPKSHKHANLPSVPGEGEITAKDMVLKKLTDEEDIRLVRKMGAFTLESIAVWVLSRHFNPFNLDSKQISTQSLIKDLDKTIREQIELSNDPGFAKVKKKGETKMNKYLYEKRKKEKAKEKAMEENCLKDDDTTKEDSTTTDYMDDTTNEDSTTTDYPDDTTTDSSTFGKMIDTTDDETTTDDTTTKKRTPKGVNKLYGIGNLLFEYLGEKGVLEKSVKGEIKTRKKNKKGEMKVKFKSEVSCVKCNFQINDVPIGVPLPMVCPPIPWGLDRGEDSAYMKYVYPEQKAELDKQIARTDKIRVEWDTLRIRSLCNLIGGYLTGHKKNGTMSSDLRLVTSQEHGDFDIHYHEYNEGGDNIAVNLNRLQEQPYSINVNFLRYLREKWDVLQQNGLVMYEFLAYVNITEGVNSIRELCTNGEFKDVAEQYGVKALINLFLKNVQQAGFEQATLELAEALVSYKFYLPVYMDFRGRNYRRGVFHFHERDLMRSLFLFATPNDPKRDPIEEGKKKLTQQQYDSFFASAAFHHAKHENYTYAANWFKNNIMITRYKKKYDPILRCSKRPEYNILNFADDESVFDYAQHAKKPFQFLASCQAALCGDIYTMKHIPITQDASASAYQILSYFLVDGKMGYYTNILTGLRTEENAKIHDIYENMLAELIKYVDNLPDCDPSVVSVIKNSFDRNTIKQIYMPLIYGKTTNSIFHDITAKMTERWDKLTILPIVDVCHKFWTSHYNEINNLMELIQMVSWYTSKVGNNVIYGNNYYKTIQNYCRKKDETLTVYYNTSRKNKSRVALKEKTDIKDHPKSKISTFANFIHQRDALLVMRVIDYIRDEERHNSIHIPIYTIHDNFLTTIERVDKLPAYYR